MSGYDPFKITFTDNGIVFGENKAESSGIPGLFTDPAADFEARMRREADELKKKREKELREDEEFFDDVVFFGKLK